VILFLNSVAAVTMHYAAAAAMHCRLEKIESSERAREHGKNYILEKSF
jgi:hypothetical protein